MATTTEFPASDCGSYDYIIVGGGTAGTFMEGLQQQDAC